MSDSHEPTPMMNHTPDEDDWRPISTIVYNGEQTLFKSPSGIYEAPAFKPIELNRNEKLDKWKATGSFPNVKYNATHWQPIKNQDNEG